MYLEAYKTCPTQTEASHVGPPPREPLLLRSERRVQARCEESRGARALQSGKATPAVKPRTRADARRAVTATAGRSPQVRWEGRDGAARLGGKGRRRRGFT